MDLFLVVTKRNVQLLLLPPDNRCILIGETPRLNTTRWVAGTRGLAHNHYRLTNVEIAV